MNRKTPIRLKIESILELDPMIHSKFGDRPRKVWSEKRKAFHRMHITYCIATQSQLDEIEKLPHVIKAKDSLYTFYRGVLVYLDCKPSSIKL
jgi:hypothetical protein